LDRREPFPLCQVSGISPELNTSAKEKLIVCEGQRSKGYNLIIRLRVCLRLNRCLKGGRRKTGFDTREQEGIMLADGSISEGQPGKKRAKGKLVWSEARGKGGEKLSGMSKMEMEEKRRASAPVFRRKPKEGETVPGRSINKTNPG